MQIYRSLNSAFLLALAGNCHDPQIDAKSFLLEMSGDPHLKDIAKFYLDSLKRIKDEIEDESNKNKDFANRLNQFGCLVCG